MSASFSHSGQVPQAAALPPHPITNHTWHDAPWRAEKVGNVAFGFNRAGHGLCFLVAVRTATGHWHAAHHGGPATSHRRSRAANPARATNASYGTTSSESAAWHRSTIGSASTNAYAGTAKTALSRHVESATSAADARGCVESASS